jgi:hypothetical protein
MLFSEAEIVRAQPSSSKGIDIFCIEDFQITKDVSPSLKDFKFNREGRFIDLQQLPKLTTFTHIQGKINFG